MPTIKKLFNGTFPVVGEPEKAYKDLIPQGEDE